MDRLPRGNSCHLEAEHLYVSESPPPTGVQRAAVTVTHKLRLSRSPSSSGRLFTLAETCPNLSPVGKVTPCTAPARRYRISDALTMEGCVNSASTPRSTFFPGRLPATLGSEETLN